MSLSTISKNIKKLRLKSGMSQQELAAKMYVTRQTISNYETGKSNPDIETLQQLAVLWDVELDTLIHGEVKKVDFNVLIKNIIGIAIVLAFVMISIFLIKQERIECQQYYIPPILCWIMLTFGFPILSVVSGWNIAGIIMAVLNVKMLNISKKVKTIIIICLILYSIIVLPLVVYLIKMKVQLDNYDSFQPSFGGSFYFGLINAYINVPILYICFIIIGLILSHTKKSSINIK